DWWEAPIDQKCDHLKCGHVGGNSREEERLYQEPELKRSDRSTDRPLWNWLASYIANGVAGPSRYCCARITRSALSNALPRQDREYDDDAHETRKHDTVGLAPAVGLYANLSHGYNCQHARAKACISERNAKAHVVIKPTTDDRCSGHHSHQRRPHPSHDPNGNKELPKVGGKRSKENSPRQK